MGILSKDESERDISRRRRRSTKPKFNDFISKYPKPPRTDPYTHIPEFQAWKVPHSFYESKPNSSRRSAPSHSSVAEGSLAVAHSDPSTSCRATLRPSSPNMPTSEAERHPNNLPLLVNTVNSIGLKILTYAFSKNTPKDTVGVCAMNIYQCLSIITVASKDASLTAFAETLRFKDLDTMVSDYLALDVYCRSSPDVELSSAVRLFTHKDLTIGKPWKDIITETYKAEVYPVAADSVNAFIQRKSQGRLEGRVSEVFLDDGLLTVVAYVYFKAGWAYSFQKKLTQSSLFHGFRRKQQRCQMMYKRGKMEYVEDGTVQMVISHYRSSEIGPKWKSAVILPKVHGSVSMKNVLSSFSSAGTLQKFLLGTKPHRTQKVHFYLPRFSLELDLNLIPALSELGLASVFAPSRDFSPVSEDVPVAASHVIQALYMEVCEEEAEIVAVTPQAIRLKHTAEAGYETMRVDRPFIFLIFDALTGFVLIQTVVCEVGPGPWRRE